MQETEIEPESIGVTTESRERQRQLLMQLVCINGFLSCIVWLAIHGKPEGKGVAGFMLAVGFGLGLTGLSYLIFLTKRGTLRMNAEGIDWAPLVGRKRQLHWSEIERVRLLQEAITVRSRNQQITIYLGVFSLADQREAKAGVEHFLGERFDFTARIEPLNVKALLKWILLAFALVVPYWWFIVYLAKAGLFAANSPQVFFVFLLLPCFFLLPFYPKAYRQERRKGWLAQRF